MVEKRATIAFEDVGIDMVAAPCRFCGGAASVKRFDAGDGECVIGVCSECGAPASFVRLDECRSLAEAVRRAVSSWDHLQERRDGCVSA